MNKVSIVIPVYNRATLLPRTLRSIEQQTYRPIELILVDNNSTDNSLEICHRFSDRAKRDDFEIKVVEEHKTGANAARNAGLRETTGEFVSFYDSDDEMKPHRIERVVQTMCRDELDALFFRVTLQDEWQHKTLKTTLNSTAVEDQILTSMVSTQAFVLRTRLAHQIGGWNEELHRWQDWEFVVRLLLSKPKCAWLGSESLDTIHVHSDSITGKGFAHSATAIHRSVLVVYELLGDDFEKHSKAYKALYFRESQLAAFCRREGAPQMAKLFEEDMKKCYPPIPLFRLTVKLLQWYTLIGGRGAWRFVRTLL